MAAPGFEPADLNFLHDHVFEGVWKKHDEPEYQRWILTLASYKVFFVMAALVLFVEFTRSRSWAIGRHIVLYSNGVPSRLHDEGRPEPLFHLSQGDAIRGSLPALGRFSLWRTLRPRRIFGPSRTDASTALPRNDPAQSGWLGVVAIFNVALFISMSIAIPALLTDGAFGAPIVKSKATEDCLTSDRMAGYMQYVMNLPRSDAIFQHCFDKVNQACDNQYHFTPPRIEKRRLDYCPFRGDVCQNQTRPFEISHMNVSMYEVGINSPSQLTLNHRLTCTPVVFDKFQLFPNLSPNYSWVSVRTSHNKTSSSHPTSAGFSVRLSTVNGPNFLSNESSGLKMSRARGPTAVTVLPAHIVPLSLSIPEYQNIIHEYLRCDDGQSFLIVLQAGRTLYYAMVDDPFFSAHNEFYIREDDDPSFLPDYEATALGCLEQYQFCIPSLSGSVFCTSWGPKGQAFSQLNTFFELGLIDLDQAYFAIAENIVFFFELTQVLGVYYYLALRNTLHDHLPLLRDQTSFSRGFYGVDEPWTSEVETWFMKSILNTIFRMQGGAKYHLANFSDYGLDPEFEREFVQEWATCGRILFRDGDYTNINWVGYCSTTAALVFICCTSYLIKYSDKCGKALFNLWADLGRMVTKIRTISAQLMPYLHNNSWWKAPLYFRQLYRFWALLPLSDLFGTRRTWYGHWQSGTAAGAMGSAGINHHPGQANHRDLNNYNMDDLRNGIDIDNPV